MNGGARTAWVQGFIRERKGKERERKGKEGKGRERKGKEGKGWERKGKGRERKGKEGKGREMKGKEGKEGKGRERKGKEGKGRERNDWEKKTLEISELGGADGCKGGWKWVGRRSRWRSASLAARTAADGKWVRRIAWTAWVQGRLEMGGEKKPLEISELGCADGCGREMGGENCADGCGRRGCKGVAGNGRW